MKYKGKVSEEFITKAWDAYIRYRSDKENLHTRVRDNMATYRAAYSAMYDEQSNNTMPKTAYILSAVENKYADYLDNYPMPNFLPREESDEDTAKLLSKLLPVQLEVSGFNKAYKADIRQKLITGTGIFGVFYDRNEKNIDIKCLDILSVFCDMNVRDVQRSQFLFICDVMDNDKLKKLYPEYSELFDGDADTIGYESDRIQQDRSEVIDCYYKKTDGSVHLLKFCHENVIAASEDMPGYEKGLYEHGLYPVVFDVMYPEADNPFGFGLVDTTKNPQRYIDRLDSAILKNAMLQAVPKWIINRNSGVNKEEFADMSKEIIEANNVEENHIRKVEVAGMTAGIMQHRNQKILELKEVAANRDVSAGGTASGVTAASAITVLQEAGDKQSRAMISDSYDAYKEVIKMVIGIMRQFFDADRVYRITDSSGKNEYKRFSRERLIRAEAVTDALGFPIDTRYKNIEFDIDIVPQKKNAFRRETNNQTIIALWNNGFFAPQNLEASAMVLPFFQFDGKEGIIQAVGEKIEEMKSQMQSQQMMQGGGGGGAVPFPEEVKEEEGDGIE